MNNRVLLVHRDPEAARDAQQALAASYAVESYVAANAAIESLQRGAAPAVVVADLRLTDRSGLDVLAAAQQCDPQTVAILLAWHHDIEFALDAVNEGYAWRALLRPCDGASLRKAVAAAIEHARVLRHEGALLRRTCAGAISSLCDVLEAQRPEVCIGLGNLSETVTLMRQSTALSEHWEFDLAARLALVGLACVTADDAEFFLRGSICDPRWQRINDAVAEHSARMIRRIPRLDLVGSIVAKSPTADGAYFTTSPVNEASLVQAGSTVLAISVTWSVLLAQRLDAKDAVVEMRRRFPKMPAAYDDMLFNWPIDGTSTAGQEVPLELLKPGMVLQRDVCTKHGDILLRCGRRMTDTLIEKLRSRQQTSGDLRPVYVVDWKQRPGLVVQA